MNKIISLGLIIGLIAASCTDPNTIGLEVQPLSDNIIISDTSSFNWQTSQAESEDSLRTDEALNLVLGEIQGSHNNSGSFLTQILLTESNIDLGTNPIIDSVILSYTYSGYYGELEKFSSLEIRPLTQPIYKDSIYYSNFSYSSGDDLLSSSSLNLDESNPLFQININEDVFQALFDLGNEVFVDNETFLTYFNGFAITCGAENTMLYLNPNGSNSYLKIFYHNEESDTLSLDFEIGGETARLSLFNEKNDESILSDNSKICIQSMAGYKMKITINNTDSIKALLVGKSINKVTMSFDIESGSQTEGYPAHERLFLVRVDEEGNNVFLSDFTDEEETHFGGKLNNEKYEFNITRYFPKLLNNSSYTNRLYILPAGAAVNANRTILEKDITLTIHYSQL